MSAPSRDSIGWWFGLIGGVATAVLASSELLEIPPEIRVWLLRVSVVVAAVSGWMKTSPLPSKQGAEVANAAAKYVDAKRALVEVQEKHEPELQDGRNQRDRPVSE